MKIWIGVGLFVGLLVLMIYAYLAASSDADKMEERYQTLHPPDYGGDEG